MDGALLGFPEGTMVGYNDTEMLGIFDGYSLNLSSDGIDVIVGIPLSVG